MITLKCRSCGVGLNAKDEQVGKRLACPKCGAPIIVDPPAKPAELISPPGIPQRQQQMTSGWFCQTMGETFGPLSPAELKAKADKGLVTRDTLVRKGIHGEWVAAWRVKGLFGTSEREEEPDYNRQTITPELRQEMALASPPTPVDCAWRLESKQVSDSIPQPDPAAGENRGQPIPQPVPEAAQPQQVYRATRARLLWPAIVALLIVLLLVALLRPWDRTAQQQNDETAVAPDETALANKSIDQKMFQEAERWAATLCSNSTYSHSMRRSVADILTSELVLIEPEVQTDAERMVLEFFKYIRDIQLTICTLGIIKEEAENCVRAGAEQAHEARNLRDRGGFTDTEWKTLIKSFNEMAEAATLVAKGYVPVSSSDEPRLVEALCKQAVEVGFVEHDGIKWVEYDPTVSKLQMTADAVLKSTMVEIRKHK